MKHVKMYIICKRFFDLFVSLFGLIILFPLFIVVSICILYNSKGPVFYKGVRTGQNGKPFRIYKFRSMVNSAEKIGSTATAKNDFRITKVGKYIRKYKIDEFPQLINVILGEMSIVGPRPEVEEHTNCYQGEEKIILTVKPGITDFSSITFRNLNDLLGNEDANKVFIEKYRNEKNRLRIEYVKKRSLGVDLIIIFKTIKVIIFN